LVAYEVTDTLQPLNLSHTTLDVELIRADIFTNEADLSYDAICENPGINIGGDSTFVTFGKTGTSSRENFTIYGPSTTPGAGHNIINEIAVKKAAVRAWYFVKKEDNRTETLLSHNCGRDITDVTGNANSLCFKQFYRDYYLQPQGIDKTGACSVPCYDAATYDAPSCYTCLKDKFASALCSRDNFAIKPSSLDLNIRDNNGTIDSNTSIQVATNIDGNNSVNIAAGYEYPVQILAPLFNTSTPARGYYADFRKENTSLSGSIANAETETHGAVAYFTPNASCIDPSSVAHTISIRNGVDVKQRASLLHENVGAYRFVVVDHNWTAVDQSDSPLKPQFSGGNPDDCKITDAKPEHDAFLNEQVGCYISSILDTDSRHTEIELNYYPYRFDVKAEYTTNHDALGFTFMHDLNMSTDNNGSAHKYTELDNAMRLDGNISAVSRTNTLTSNFVDGCINTSLDLDINATHMTPLGTDPAYTIMDNAGNPVRYQYYILDRTLDTIEKYENETNGTGDNINFDISHFNTLDTNGSAILSIRHNIKRKPTRPISPVDTTILDINFTLPIDIRANQITDYHAIGGLIPANATTNFYYGTIEFTRGADERVITEYSDEFIVNTILKIYSDYADSTAYGIDNAVIGLRPRWHSIIGDPFIDERYDATKEPGTIAAPININGNATQANNLGVAVDDITYTWGGTEDQKVGPAKLFIDAPYWLKYNRNFSGLYPNGDIFIRLFFSPAGDWTGGGNTGRTVGETIHQKSSDTRRKTW